MSVFPVLANADNVFYIQPLAEGYPPHQMARAVASALFYRYTGINSGLGSSSTSLLLQPQPLHVLQTVFAEWLLVYSHLSDVISTSRTAELAEPYIGTHKAPQVMLAASGNHVPSFVSLLGFLSDWVGSVLPLYTNLTCGDTASVAMALMDNVNQIRVTNLPKTSPVYRAYISGCGLAAADFIHSLNTMFTNSNGAEPHPTRIISVQGHAPVNVRVRRLARKQSSVPLPVDIFVSYPDDFAMTIPSTIQLSDIDIPDTVRGINVLVCSCAELPGACFAVYPIELSDAVLQRVPVLAAAETLVNAISVSSPGFAELREVTSKVLLMGFILPSTDVKHIIRKAFTDSFPYSAVAGGDGISLAAAATLVVPPESDESEAVAFPVPAAPRTGDLTVKEYITTLYFLPAAFEALRPQLVKIDRFFTDIQFAEGKGDGRFCVLNTDKKLIVASAERRKRAEGNPSPGETEVFGIIEHAENVSKSRTCFTDLSGVPMTSVVFTREDLLAITLSGESTHSLLQELWSLHVRNTPGCNFEDDASAEIINDIVESGSDALRHAGLWAHGVLVEIIFAHEDGVEATGILAALYDSLQVLVLEHKGRTLVSYRSARDAAFASASILIRAELISEHARTGAGRMSLTPLTRAFKLTVADADSVTEPWLRGVCISLTQLSLFRCAQQYYEEGAGVRDAFRALLKSADTSVIPANELAIAMNSDIKAFRRAIASL